MRQKPQCHRVKAWGHWRGNSNFHSSICVNTRLSAARHDSGSIQGDYEVRVLRRHTNICKRSRVEPLMRLHSTLYRVLTRYNNGNGKLPFNVFTKIADSQTLSRSAPWLSPRNHDPQSNQRTICRRNSNISARLYWSMRPLFRGSTAPHLFPRSTVLSRPPTLNNFLSDGPRTTLRTLAWLAF